MSRLDKISKVYAAALIDIGREKNILVEIEDELSSVSSLIREDENVWKFFKSPVIHAVEKQAVLEKYLKNVVSPTMFNFLGVIAHRGRMEDLQEIATTYSHLLDEALGRKRIQVRSALALTQQQQDDIKSAMKSFLKTEIILEQTTDPDLIGGMIIRSGDLMIDTSVETSLIRMRKALLERRILGEGYYEN